MSTRSILSSRQFWPLLLALCLLACTASASIENPSLETTVTRRLKEDTTVPPGANPDDGEGLGQVHDGEVGGGGKVGGVQGADGNPSIETTTKPPGGDTEQVDDVCATAGTSCPACSIASKTFVENDDYTCAFQIGTTETVMCQKVKKSDVDDRGGDMCSKTNEEDKVTAAPGDPTVTDKPSAQPEEGKEGGGGALFLIVGLVVVMGGICVAKRKMGAKAPPGSAPVKHGKYETVAAVDAELETDDWDDWGEGSGGDVEMQPPFRDDNSLTRRTSSDKSVDDDDDFGWGGSSSTSAPQIVPKRSPRTTPPKWQDTEKRSSPPVSKPPLSSTGRMPTAPRSAPTGLSLSSESTPPQAKITSLGKKIQKLPPKKAPPKQDDIFASMGLSSKPKFTPAPKPTTAAPRSVSATGGSRWAQTTTATTMGATTATNFGAAELKATASMDDGDNDNWDDDGDLDDLLDD